MLVNPLLQFVSFPSVRSPSALRPPPLISSSLCVFSLPSLSPHSPPFPYFPGFVAEAGLPAVGASAWEREQRVPHLPRIISAATSSEAKCSSSKVLTPPVCSALSHMLMPPSLLSLQGDTPRELVNHLPWLVGGMGKGAASSSLTPPASRLHQPRPKLSALPSGSHLLSFEFRSVCMLMPPSLLSLQGDTPRESTTFPAELSPSTIVFPGQMLLPSLLHLASLHSLRPYLPSSSLPPGHLAAWGGEAWGRRQGRQQRLQVGCWEQRAPHSRHLPRIVTAATHSEAKCSTLPFPSACPYIMFCLSCILMHPPLLLLQEDTPRESTTSPDSRRAGGGRAAEGRAGRGSAGGGRTGGGRTGGGRAGGGRTGGGRAGGGRAVGGRAVGGRAVGGMAVGGRAAGGRAGGGRAGGGRAIGEEKGQQQGFIFPAKYSSS
ncbi:unnamed protein product [Closterium sp. Naga37s-1]|nr:unnamed protein product [Closterium sp. Naga37s-1]